MRTSHSINISCGRKVDFHCFLRPYDSYYAYGYPAFKRKLKDNRPRWQEAAISSTVRLWSANNALLCDDFGNLKRWPSMFEAPHLRISRPSQYSIDHFHDTWKVTSEPTLILAVHRTIRFTLETKLEEGDKISL